LRSASPSSGRWKITPTRSADDREPAIPSDLIPESRGTSRLLESADRILNTTTDTLLEFSVQRPPFRRASGCSFRISSGGHQLQRSYGRRHPAYFRNLDAVRDNINKVQLYRREANRWRSRSTGRYFADGFPEHEDPYPVFLHAYQSIAEQSDDVCDRLAIAVIKKSE